MDDSPRIVTRHIGGHLWVIRLAGEHDLATAPDLRRTIDDVFATGTCLIVDLSTAAFIDSSILGELIRANLRADGSPDEKLAVVAPPASRAARLFDAAGVDGTWFPRFDSTGEAIEWCGGPSTTRQAAPDPATNPDRRAQVRENARDAMARAQLTVDASRRRRERRRPPGRDAQEKHDDEGAEKPGRAGVS